MVRKIFKHVIHLTLLIYIWTSPAFAKSEYVDNWIGTWTVKMKDGSIVTWKITHTWASETKKSHLAYGIKYPGKVEFQIYFGTMFKNHNYIEISHKTTVYDLPMLFTRYTRLIPSDEFKSFTAKKGRHPVKEGMKETERPAPAPEAVLINNDENTYRAVGNTGPSGSAVKCGWRKILKQLHIKTASPFPVLARIAQGRRITLTELIHGTIMT